MSRVRDPSLTPTAHAHGGRRKVAGRSKSQVAKFDIKVDVELQDRWNSFKILGSFKTTTEFLSHLLHLEED